MRFLLPFLTLIATASCCYDQLPSYCTSQGFRFCRSHQVVRDLCKKTCGLCGGGGGGPPTPAPPTPGPPPPVTPRPGGGGGGSGSCGRRQVAVARVIAGQNARRGAWPWQIVLKQNGMGTCGGTIIDKRWILTAAHCLDSDPSPYRYSVTVGELDLNVREGSEATYRVSKVIMHPTYRSNSVRADIGLLKLSSDIQYNRYVQPACLPNRDITPGHQQCYITGFGKIRHPGNSHHYLQQGRMPPFSQSRCGRTGDMLCAGLAGSRVNGCHGDSGGPYVCEVNGNWEVHGAVSHGSATCNSADGPTVFSRVFYFKSWIQQTMRYQ